MSDIPFWNVNIPATRHTEACPDYLQYALSNDKDRMILSTLDADYQRQTWDDVQQFVHDNRLDLFQRLPSDLRRYREYCTNITDEYGSVMAFVMKERLQWQDLTPSSSGEAMFADAANYKILYNDWPYGVDERIRHIVVWTKFSLSTDSPTNDSHPDDLTPEARKQISDFVDKTFSSVCGRGRVIWFKNWSSLKSIHAVEHFHVMLYDPPEGFVRDITGGDVPLACKVGSKG